MTIPVMAIDAAYAFGRQIERNSIVKRIKDNVCFDALNDPDGRCSNHSGKCYEILLLVAELEKEIIIEV